MGLNCADLQKRGCALIIILDLEVSRFLHRNKYLKGKVAVSRVIGITLVHGKAIEVQMGEKCGRGSCRQVYLGSKIHLRKRGFFVPQGGVEKMTHAVTYFAVAVML